MTLENMRNIALIEQKLLISKLKSLTTPTIQCIPNPTPCSPVMNVSLFISVVVGVGG